MDEQEWYNKLASFVAEIANDDPVYPNGWINECKYCHVSWPENPSDHDEDCIWLRAKLLLNA